ncbi:hypothetical protein [Mycolicibacterium goodii]|uniref:Diacylglycerol O-acyltransferase n=1 Tax=Mycolicibacterium goodii TaxID=134601 RepID=A0A0K0X9Z5_MYCGD|nr:hypothetical protein AFA91_22630 [Mycolicibacterium goodii]
MDNVLDLVDHTIFSLERAAGTTSLIQGIWMYDRTIDLAALRQFHARLQRGRLARRIELSALPFGRHRWVTAETTTPLELGAARPRADFDAWLEEQAATPLDAERGPGWHLAVLPFTDGGAGISLVASHCVTDAVGLCQALADAVSGAACGDGAGPTWPAAGTRGKLRGLGEDICRTLRDIPDIGRAAVAAARFVRRNSAASAPSTRSATLLTPMSSAPRDPDTNPTVTVFVDAAEWESRAATLGGTSNTLLAAVAARLAQRIGRVADDGTATLTMPISQRRDGDTRANAITNVDITVTPTTSDLRTIRAATKSALSRAQEQPDERWTLLPLVPLAPAGVRRQWADTATNSAASVGASNVGTIPAAVLRIDGFDADRFAMRSVVSGLTPQMRHRQGGLLSVLSGLAHGAVFLSVTGWQPGSLQSEDALRQCLSESLDDFALTVVGSTADSLSTMRTTGKS